MNKETLMILGGGLVAALVVAFLMQAMIGGGNDEPERVVKQVASPQTQILIATKDLQMGEQLESSDMRWKNWPEDSLFNGAVTKDSLENPDVDMPIEGRLRRAVAEGEPLLQSALVNENEGNFVAATLSEGMRAVAISVNAQSSVGGFVKPGDLVDVIMTYEVRLPTDEDIIESATTVVNRRAAQTILENVKVMATDQKATDGGQTAVARTVTLEVTPEQGEELALASSMGDLSLALRKIGDKTTRLDKEMGQSSATDIRMSRIIQEIINGDTDGTGPSKTIKVYSGSSIQEVKVPTTANGGE